MVQILRMDATAVVLYGDLNGVGQSFPCNMNRVAALRMVEGVFHDVVNGLGQPVAVAEKKDLLRAGQDKFFMLLFGPVCEMQLNVPQHIRHILGRLFQYDRTGVQLGDLEQALYQRFNAVKLLFGQAGEFFYGGRFYIFLMKQAIINIQCRQRCFQLVGNIGDRIFQKFLFPKLVICVGVQNRRQGIDGMEQPI